MNFLRRLDCLLYGHRPLTMFEFPDKHYGFISVWLCEDCHVYYKEVK